MRVEELIEKLAAMPQAATVLVEVPDEGDSDNERAEYDSVIEVVYDGGEVLIRVD